jgi:RNA polymerase sigma-70 factor (ECF subfamily)
MTDATLIARVLGGDLDAFRGVVDRYWGDCARFAYRMLGHRQDAEDALQETFLRAYRGLGRYREREQFRSWLYRILVNRCRTLARQRGRRDHRLVLDEAALQRAAAEGHEPDAELRDALQVALARLDDKQREAFLLKHGEGLEYVEMAMVTGASVPALKMRVKRACEAMRPELEAMLHGG